MVSICSTPLVLKSLPDAVCYLDNTETAICRPWWTCHLVHDDDDHLVGEEQKQVLGVDRRRA